MIHLASRPCAKPCAITLRRARGLVLSPERVILTSTSRTDQAARLLINVGDTVAIEDPWYPVSRRILMAHGPSLVTVSRWTTTA
jgi:DNA-binding transcriptional MocR family regulator